MDIWSLFPAAALFALACNLDTVALAMGFALRGRQVSPGGIWTIALVTTAVTLLALLAGQLAAGSFAPGLAQRVGALVLTGMGVWFFLDALGAAPAGAEDRAAPAGSYLSLAVALGVNNACAGVAAGASGIHPLLAAGANLAVTLAALALGRRLGSGRIGKALGRAGGALSGLLLAGLGLAQLLG